jgi:hypothetical protein
MSIESALSIDQFISLKDLAKKRQIMLECPRETEQLLSDASLDRYKQE